MHSILETVNSNSSLDIARPTALQKVERKKNLTKMVLRFNSLVFLRVAVASVCRVTFFFRCPIQTRQNGLQFPN